MSAHNLTEILSLDGQNFEKMENICRCCLAAGCKDISAEYYVYDQKEVYEDLLRRTFDIQLSHINDAQTNRNVICESCIIKLREAFTFKQMVLRSNDVFVQYFKERSRELEVTGSNPKLEDIGEIKKEIESEHCDVFRDDDSFDDNEVLANIKLELSKDQFPTKRKQKIKVGKKKGKLKMDCRGNENEKLASKEKSLTKIAEQRGSGPILRENSLKLISNSTICVFQWNKSRYRCFVCKEPFSDMALLRDHTKIHNIEEIRKIIILQQNRLVKVEISVLNCIICEEKINNLNSLRTHLEEHNINFDSQEDLLVPFKIDSNLSCQICGENFTMFRLLNIHVNKHYQKQVCHICGAGFSNLVFLNLHKSRSHRVLMCKECNVKFKNKFDKREHDSNVHNLKIVRKLRFPCPYCNERFFQENFRVQHLVDKHGMIRPEYKCSLCSKVFITKSLLNNHVKRVHMKEKNQECDVCHHFFYTKPDVLRHKVTHTGEKKFSCNICNTLLASRDSLRRHMKRTHAGISMQ